MPDNVYWDACVILEYLNGDADRAPHVNALLDSASKAQIQIHTSTLSIVEVAFASHDKAGRALSPETEAIIESLWATGAPIRLMEFHRVIAEDARRLCQTAMTKNIQGVRSADAVHLATALTLGVDVFHTYEEETTRTKWAALTGLVVCEPLSTTPQLGI